MLNIIELENRWLKYKIKSYLPYASIIISLLVILLISYSFIDKNSPDIKLTQELQTHPKNTIVVLKEKKVPQLKEKITPSQPILKQETKIIKLSPSLDFMKKMQNSVQPYYTHEHTNYNTFRTPVKVNVPKVEKVPKKKIVVQAPKVKVDSHRIKIKRQNTQNDIHEIIQRFKNNNNPALSLFVAKKYYELENYNQAYNYALITNKINKDIEVSWIIFAKSLVKLGKKNQAINTLKKYIKQSHSSSAQILVDEIQSGKFQ